MNLLHRANWRYSTPKPAVCQIIRVIRKTQRSDHAPETHHGAKRSFAEHAFYGDNLPILREYVLTDSADLVYLDPPFNSNRSYNVLFLIHPCGYPDLMLIRFLGLVSSTR